MYDHRMCLAWDAAVMLMGEISRFGSVKVDVVECPDRMGRATEMRVTMGETFWTSSGDRQRLR